MQVCLSHRFGGPHPTQVSIESTKGRTALLEAAVAGNALLAEELVAAGARADYETKDGATALGVASALGHYQA